MNFADFADFNHNKYVFFNFDHSNGTNQEAA